MITYVCHGHIDDAGGSLLDEIVDETVAQRARLRYLIECVEAIGHREQYAMFVLELFQFN